MYQEDLRKSAQELETELQQRGQEEMAALQHKQARDKDQVRSSPCMQNLLFRCDASDGALGCLPACRCCNWCGTAAGESWRRSAQK